MRSQGGSGADQRRRIRDAGPRVQGQVTPPVWKLVIDTPAVERPLVEALAASAAAGETLVDHFYCEPHF